MEERLKLLEEKVNAQTGIITKLVSLSVTQQKQIQLLQNDIFLIKQIK